MKVESLEICSTPNSTVSMLYVDGIHLHFVIEDGYRAVKMPGETRIEGGVYYLVARRHGKFYEKYKRQFGHEFAIEIMGSKTFTDLLFHIGNSKTDTRGCNLNNSGFKRDKASGDYVGIDSTIAYMDFYKLLYPELKAGNKVPFMVYRKPLTASIKDILG